MIKLPDRKMFWESEHKFNRRMAKTTYPDVVKSHILNVASAKYRNKFQL